MRLTDRAASFFLVGVHTLTTVAILGCAAPACDRGSPTSLPETAAVLPHNRSLAGQELPRLLLKLLRKVRQAAEEGTHGEGPKATLAIDDEERRLALVLGLEDLWQEFRATPPPAATGRRRHSSKKGRSRDGGGRRRDGRSRRKGGAFLQRLLQNWTLGNASQHRPALAGLRVEEFLKSNQRPVVITKASHLKKDWCRTEPLKQRIRQRGCRPRVVVNNFCYGQCNSFYIPKVVPTAHDGTPFPSTTPAPAFLSCAFCKPHRVRWIVVTLHCPGLVPPFQKKRVQRVEKCRCLTEILR